MGLQAHEYRLDEEMAGCPIHSAYFAEWVGKYNDLDFEALYQGTTLVVPQMPQNRPGFSPCGNAVFDT